MNTEPGVPRRPGDIRNAPPHGIPARATPRQGTPIHPDSSAQAGGPIPPGAPTRPIVHPPAGPSATPSPQSTGPQATPVPHTTGPQAAVAPHVTGPQPSPGSHGTGPQPAVGPHVTGPQSAQGSRGTGPQSAVGPQGTGPQAVQGSQGTGPQSAVGSQGTGPQGRVDPQEPPRVWGRPPESPPRPNGQAPEAEVRGSAAWAGVPEAQDAYFEQDEPSSTTGPMGARETSGVQVRLGSRERERERRARRQAGRRSGLVAAGVLVLAGLVTAGLVLTRGSGDGGTGGAATAGQRPNGADAPLPRAGKPIEVGTADGSKYRLATVTSGVSDGVATTFQSTPPSGTSFAYIEYLLTNPTDEKVLLDFPGDVFVKRELVTPDARGRCMPQAGVPEDLCTPPTKSQVVKRLRGGGLIAGEGGDKYMPPGATYLVRATVDVPVQQSITRKDMGLYVWKQLYMADQLAKPVPFPG